MSPLTEACLCFPTGSSLSPEVPRWVVFSDSPISPYFFSLQQQQKQQQDMSINRWNAQICKYYLLFANMQGLNDIAV